MAAKIEVRHPVQDNLLQGIYPDVVGLGDTVEERADTKAGFEGRAKNIDRARGERVVAVSPVDMYFPHLDLILAALPGVVVHAHHIARCAIRRGVEAIPVNRLSGLPDIGSAKLWDAEALYAGIALPVEHGIPFQGIDRDIGVASFVGSD